MKSVFGLGSWIEKRRKLFCAGLKVGWPDVEEAYREGVLAERERQKSSVMFVKDEYGFKRMTKRKTC